jgi:PAS domain S-box-containing protein
VTKTSNLESAIDYQQLVEVIGDAVVVADASGAINLWNPAAERLFGFRPAEALDKSLNLIIPERLRERHWAGYRKTIASGRRATLTTCCEFQPCTRTGERCRLHLRSDCFMGGNER